MLHVKNEVICICIGVCICVALRNPSQPPGQLFENADGWAKPQ